MTRLRVGLLQTDVAHTRAEAVGQVIRHQMVPGAPFPLADLAHAALVQRGDRIQMRLQSTGIELTAQGIELARRTVAKYRKILNIPTARQRREY